MKASSKKLSKSAAKELAESVGVNFSKDFYEQPLSVSSELVAIAKLAKYSKPKNANGSTARYFFAHLQKVK